MVLKYNDLQGNWNFLEGEISYRFKPFCDVIVDCLTDNGFYYETNETKVSAIGKSKEEIVNDYRRFLKEYENTPTFFEMVCSYIRKHFDKADDGMTVDISQLPSQEPEDLYGINFVEIYKKGELETNYILLNTGMAFILGENGKTIERLM